MATMQSKYDAIINNGMWYLTNIPIRKKVVGIKRVYKLKCKPDDGSVDYYNARLVAKGHA